MHFLLFSRYAVSEVSSHSLGGERRDSKTQVHTLTHRLELAIFWQMPDGPAQLVGSKATNSIVWKKIVGFSVRSLQCQMLVANS